MSSSQAELKRLVAPKETEAMPEGPVKLQNATMERLGALLQHMSRRTSQQKIGQGRYEALTLEIKHLRKRLQMAEAIALNQQHAAEELRENLKQEDQRRLEAERLNSFQAAWHVHDCSQRWVCEAYASVLLQQL